MCWGDLNIPRGLHKEWLLLPKIPDSLKRRVVAEDILWYVDSSGLLLFDRQFWML